jgi:hypothetical protein
MCESAAISNVSFSKTNPPKRIEDKSLNNVWELYSIDCSLIEEIGSEAFAWSSLEKIIFDEHLKLVENLAFEEWGTGGSWSDSNKVYYNGNFK